MVSDVRKFELRGEGGWRQGLAARESGNVGQERATWPKVNCSAFTGICKVVSKSKRARSVNLKESFDICLKVEKDHEVSITAGPTFRNAYVVET